MSDRDVPFVAQNIVNQLGDLWKVPVDLRQSTNDEADQFVAALIEVHIAAEVKVLTEAALRLGRQEAGEEIAVAIEAKRGAPDEHGRWSRAAFTAALTCAATIARNISSQPSGAVSDASSGVPEGPGVTCPDCGLTDDHKGGCPQTGEAPQPGAPG